METTRHFTATVYIVNDGATALHRHAGLEIRIPPGGHVDRDECPHEAGRREVREETGLDPTLHRETAELTPPAGEVLPQPAHMLLYDINTQPDGTVGHQHIDHIYFAAVESREIEPEAGEAPADRWAWYTPTALHNSDLDPDTIAIGCEAIETIDNTA
ncbi:NUDIX domain-containing protein [Halonotius pteroides]|uniref:NUDIX hydrolase n=1 Tax=Halonotius pteroides TaxID=268735 RepID=A0A3A6QKT1_9EURY|nr:NUDIX domain-containing protein [Halonotius pteroides]RJX48060.1 NUDIX hydrolase [Halonotius pteroides]